MDAIERAIRNAFEKGDPEDPAFRERVYESAFAALDRALKSHPGMTVEAAIQRRKALQARIAEIEAEFQPAQPPLTDEPSLDVAPDIDPAFQSRTAAPDFSAFGDAPRNAAVPTVSLDDGPFAEDARNFGPAPVLDRAPPDPGSVGAEVEPDPNRRRARRSRKPFALAFLIVTLLVGAGMGVWWAMQTGLLMTAAERDTTVPNPPQTVEDEDFSPEDAAPGTPPPLHSDTGEERQWINVFTPSDPTLVNAPGGSSAEVMQDESGTFLRIRSGDGGAAVLFDVGQGILEQAAGKKAVFDIIARAEEGKETEITVDCDFGELGDCGRKRYLVGYERGEYLFEVALPAQNPGAGGTIAINSDFSSQGKSVDIYEIRVSVSE